MLLLRASALWVHSVCTGLKVSVTLGSPLTPFYGEAGKNSVRTTLSPLGPVWRMLPAEVVTSLHDLSSFGRAGSKCSSWDGPRAERTSISDGNSLPRKCAVSGKTAEAPDAFAADKARSAEQGLDSEASSALPWIERMQNVVLQFLGFKGSETPSLSWPSLSHS